MTVVILILLKQTLYEHRECVLGHLKSLLLFLKKRDKISIKF